MSCLLPRFITVAAFILAISASAQPGLSLLAGANYASLHNDRDQFYAWKPMWGFRIGTRATWQANEKRGYFMQLDYSQAGGVLKYAYPDYKFRVHYLAVPFSFYWNVKKLKVYCGPEINILLKHAPNDRRIFDPGKEYDDIDYGVHIGFDYKIIQPLAIGVRNYFGLKYNYFSEYLFEPQLPLLPGNNFYMNRNNIVTFYVAYDLTSP